MSGTWRDPRVLPPEACVLRPLLDRRAAEHPGKVFVRFADDTDWTYAEVHHQVRETAAGFQRLGVRQGENVHVWLPNGPDALRVWFALNYIGAVYVPLNLAYRGPLLEHAIRLSGARLIIAHGDLLPRLAEIDRAALTDAVALGGPQPSPIAGIALHPASALRLPGGEPAPPERPIAPWDTQMIIYTSGTTGPSKGVLCSYLHTAATAFAAETLGPDDCNMVNLPLFHASGTSAVWRMLVKGGSCAIVEAFETRTFWDQVRRTQTTCLTLLGAMVPFLMKQPPGPDDRNHTLRTVTIVPLSDDAEAFAERFGVDVYTTFNMTETSWPLVSGRNPTVRGTCGRPRPGVEARIVDANDCEVAPGETGELILRTDAPWAMNHGYHGDPLATASAWRNGWFHTGDAFRRDADGNFFFVDRLKDAIRRRGENISSFEVEAVIGTHEAVREVAVVGVPSEFGEDEVMAVVAPVDGKAIDYAELIAFLRPRLPHFMVPRYLRLLRELPKTPTQKIEKHKLRAEGITVDTWDREAAGLRIRREKLST
jgi:crotonobetaine/carnitine-CoA ligase